MDAPPRVGARLLALGGALAVATFFGAVMPLGLLASGYPWTAATLSATAAPLVAFLAMLGIAPRALQRLLSRFTRLDLSDAGHVAAGVIMAGTLFFVLGYGALVNGVFSAEAVLVHGDEEILTGVTGEALMQGLVLNLLVLVLPCLFYVSFVHGQGPVATLASLGLHGRNGGRALLVGFALALAVLLAIVVTTTALAAAGVHAENPRALAIARTLTPLGAVAVALGASLSEEVFFRGFLQPRVGLWGQALLFSLAHLSYVNVAETLVTFGLGLLFGYAYRRTGNLLAPMGAHFLFNLVMLLAGIYAPTEPA